MDRTTSARSRRVLTLPVGVLALAAATAVVAVIAVAMAACGGTGTAAAGAPSPAAAADPATGQLTAAAGMYTGRGIIAFTKVRPRDDADWEEVGLYGVRSNGRGLVPLDMEREAMSPTRSPDGRETVYGYSRGPSGYPGLYVLSADGMHRRQLTTPPPGQWDSAPVWAADGRIFFIRHDDRQYVGAVCSLSADGSHLTQVAVVAGLASFALSPDAAWLVIWDSHSDRIVRALANGHGGELVLVDRVRSYDCLPIALSWSPDGRRIAFASASGGWLEMPSALYVMNADGSRLRNVPGVGKVFDPVWLPQSP